MLSDKPKVAVRNARSGTLQDNVRNQLLVLAMLFLAAPAVRADYAVLRNGQRLHVTGYQRQGPSIELQIDGGRVVLPSDEVVRFEPEDLFQSVPAPATSAHGPFGGIIHDAAQKHGVDERLITSVIATESNFQPRAVSPKHAQGLMQLMPFTATRLAVTNVFDPAQNVDAGTRYLKQMLGLYHQDLNLALAAYNAGPERVNQYGGVPPFPETHAYIRRVTKALAKEKKTETEKNTSNFRSVVCSPFELACKEKPAGTP